ncbi:MAG: hypothetical protein EAX96_20225 [Candidatus Lokiarchaeota archaeon]|nr:hypothetical protein [Candidatus Lokiarchaeota archaeon]
MTMDGTYIIDANFFIGLFNTRKQNGMYKLIEAVNQLGLRKRLVTTNVVYNELKLPRAVLESIKEVLRTFPIRPSDIDDLKTAKDPRKIPQDPDLSLVALAEKIKNTQPNPIIIVTNDYKLSQFIRKYTPKYAVLPPSSFWLSLTNNLSEPNLKRYFQQIRKEITQYEFEYILQRRDVYNPREKLNWIVEKAINVAQSTSIGTVETKIESNSIDDWIKKVNSINKYVNGQPLQHNEKKLIDPFLKFTKSLIESNKSLNTLLECSISDINNIKEKLVKDYQLSQCNLENYEDKILFQSIITKKIATFEFLTALILLESSEFEEAFTHFDYTAMYSMLASLKDGNGTSIIKTMYLKALSYLHNDLFRNAEEEFEYTQKLAESYKDNKYLIISMTGQAICKYLQGDSDGAKELMMEVKKLVEKDKLNNLYMLYEFAENIYFLDRPVIAIHFYDEAMEIASELGKKVLIDKIKDRLRRCFYAVGQYYSPEEASIDEIIDLLHDQTDQELYDNAQAEIFGELNKKLNEKFPYTTNGKWVKGISLDKALKESFDLVSSDIQETFAVNVNMAVELNQCGMPCFPEEMVKKGKRGKKKKSKKSKSIVVVDEITETEVHPEETEKETILFSLSNKLGGIAFKIPGEIKIKIPELYSIQIKSDAQYMIEESQQLDKDRFYMRAVVHVKSQDDLIIKKHAHKVYGIFFEN